MFQIFRMFFPWCYDIFKKLISIFFSFFVVLHRFAQTQKNCRGREGCLRGVMVQRAVACSSWKDGQANQGIKVSLKNHTSFKKEPKNEEETKWSKKLNFRFLPLQRFHRIARFYTFLSSIALPLAEWQSFEPGPWNTRVRIPGAAKFFFSLGCGTVKL